ncbi:hypothetical protein ACJX0J_017093, partial [Zea mays]
FHVVCIFVRIKITLKKEYIKIQNLEEEKLYTKMKKYTIYIYMTFLDIIMIFLQFMSARLGLFAFLPYYMYVTRDIIIMLYKYKMIFELNFKRKIIFIWTGGQDRRSMLQSCTHTCRNGALNII